jgi:uncharacterized protein
MIVDVHAHTPKQLETQSEAILSAKGYRGDKQYKTNLSWAEFQRDMAPVDKVIMLGVAHGTNTPNEEIARWASMWPEKIVPFCSVDPTAPNVMDELTHCVEDLHVRGIKLSPHYMQHDPLDPRAQRIYAYAERRGLPVAFHQATSPMRLGPLRYAHPMALDEVAMAYPELRMVIAHFGHPWEPDCIVMIRKHPNVYTDISAQFYRPWQFYNALVLCQEYAQMHKVFFGTDWPVTTPQETLDALRAINHMVEGTHLPRVDEDEVEGIIQRDALGLLGIG